MKKIFFFIIICSNVFGLTIDEAVQNALTNNYILKSYKASLKSKKYETESSKSMKMPTFFLDSSYTKMNDDKKLTVEMAPGVSSSITQVKNHYFDTTIGIQYNIYTGGALSSNVKIKALNEQSANYNYSEFINELTFQTKKRYIDILKLNALKHIAEKHLNALKNHYQDAEKFYKQGLVAQIDLLQTNVKLKEAQQNLVKVNNNIKVAKAALSLITQNNVENTNFTIKEISGDFLLKKDINQLYEIAIKNRPLIKQYDANLKALKESKKIANADYLPKIYATGGYNYNNQNDEITPKGGFFAKLGIKMNISWDTPSKNKKAINENIIALNNQKLNKILEIKLQVKNAYESYQTALNNLKVAKSAVEEAKEYFRILKLKYDNGLASNSDLLDAEALLTNSLSNEKNAYYDLLIAYFEIEKTIGQKLR